MVADIIRKRVFEAGLSGKPIDIRDFDTPDLYDILEECGVVKSIDWDRFRRPYWVVLKDLLVAGERGILMQGQDVYRTSKPFAQLTEKHIERCIESGKPIQYWVLDRAAVDDRFDPDISREENLLVRCGAWQMQIGGLQHGTKRFTVLHPTEAYWSLRLRLSEVVSVNFRLAEAEGQLYNYRYVAAGTEI